MQQKDERKRFYELLVRTHAADLYRFAYRLCGEPETSQDLVQETYSEAWRSLDSLRDTAKARAWLFSILRYRHAHLQRDRGHKAGRHESLEAHERTAAQPGPDQLDVLAGRDSLQKALEALDIRFKEPFLMVFLEGLSCAETARQLAVPLGTVLSRVHRARMLLRTKLHRLETDKPEYETRSEKPEVQ